MTTAEMEVRDDSLNSDDEFLNESAYHDLPTVSPKTLLFFVLAIGACFFLVDHSFRASSYFKKVQNLELEANRTADRIEAVNLVSTPMRLLLGGLGVYFLFNTPRNNLRWGGMILFAFGMYFAYLSMSMAWSVNFKVTAQKLVVFGMMSVASYGLARRLSLQDLAKVFSLVCLCYIFGGLVIEIALGNFKPYLPDYRFVGTSHPNSLAAYGTVCCLAAPVFTKRGESFSYITIAMVIIGITVLLATKSRTTLAGLMFAVLSTRFITFKPKNRIFGVSFMLLLFALFGIFLSVSRSSTWNAMGGAMAMGRTEDVGSLTGRLPLMGRAWDFDPKAAYLSAMATLAYWEKDRIEYLSDILGWEIPHGHNMYLDLLLDGGIVGTEPLFVLSFNVAVRFVQTLFEGTAISESRLCFGMLLFALDSRVRRIAVQATNVFCCLSFVTTTLRLGMLPNGPIRTTRIETQN